RGDQRGQEVIASVAGRSVAVPVTIVSWQKSLHELLEVRLRARVRLHEGQSCRGMRKENVEKALASGVAGVRLDLLRDVCDQPASGVDLELLGLHERELTRLILRLGSERRRQVACV